MTELIIPATTQNDIPSLIEQLQRIVLPKNRETNSWKAAFILASCCLKATIKDR